MARTAVPKRKGSGRAVASPANGGDAPPGTTGDGAVPAGNGQAPGSRISGPALARVERALRAAADGDFSVRLPARRKDAIGALEGAYNQLAARNAALEAELVRVGQIIGREGRMTERARLQSAEGAWGGRSIPSTA